MPDPDRQDIEAEDILIPDILSQFKDHPDSDLCRGIHTLGYFPPIARIERAVVISSLSADVYKITGVA